MQVSVAGLMHIQPEVRDKFAHYAFVAAFVGCLGQVISIALAHASLGVALVCLLISRKPFRAPPVMVPLVGFAVWTLLSLAFSDDPAAGWPQVKKLALLLAVPIIIYSLFRTGDQIRRMLEALFVAMLASSLTAIAQFVWKVGEAYAEGYSFIEDYVGQRITGFYSHWITFSDVLMLITLILAAYLLFARRARYPVPGVWLGVGFVLGLTVVLSFTRSVWAATLAGGAYLVWHWRPRLLWIAPAALLLVITFAPSSVQQRFQSFTDPDSYSNRIIMWRTGAQMIDAHPWFGVGPERVGPRFDDFQPEDIVDLPLGYYEHLHSVPIHYAAERGIPAALFMIWFLLKVLWDHASAASRTRAQTRGMSWLPYGVAAATLAMIVVGLSDIALGDSEVLGVYLTLVALGYRAIALEPSLPSPANRQ